MPFPIGPELSGDSISATRVLAFQEAVGYAGMYRLLICTPFPSNQPSISLHRSVSEIPSLLPPKPFECHPVAIVPQLHFIHYFFSGDST